jgi:hypothetical protein
LHRAWPNGNEKDILDEGSTATATLKRASDAGELPEYAKLFIQDAATLEAAKDRQGKPGSGGLFPGASDDGDAGSNADDDDDDIELEPGIDDALEGGPNLLTSPIVPIDYSSSQLLSKDKYQSFQNHVVKITHETTETLKKRNQRNSAEVFDRHVPFAQEIQSEMERQLKEDIESFPFAEEGKPSLQGDLFDHVEKRMTADDGKPLKMVVSGAAGTGKSRLIRAVVNRGHLLWGKTESQYGSVLGAGGGPHGLFGFCCWRLHVAVGSEQNQRF